MQRFYIIISFLILSFQANDVRAQDLADSRTSSYYTFIYKLNNEQAQELYSDMWNLENSYLNTLHDFFPIDSLYNKTLPIGHYLFVSAKNGDFSGELQSVNNIDIKLLNNHRDLMMVFYDSTGKEISDAEVAVKRKKVRFDLKTQSYRLKKANKRGLVSARYQGHTSCVEIDRQYNNGFFVRTGRKIIHSFPVKDIISPVIYLKKNVQNIINGGRPYLPPIFYKATRPLRPKQYQGFIVFNKPEYKPGDTVKLKAFITTRKGKPFKKSATVILKQYRPEYLSRKLRTVEPFHDGAYKFEFKLTDILKLQLDNSYTIEFTNKKGHTLISNSFRFEDYELKSNAYSLRRENNGDGRPAALFFKGTDSNDMPLFDVRAEILLKPSAIKNYYQQNVFIKDTLWFYQTKLEPIGETKVVLPDSIMPSASIEYTAVVSFLNSENERVVKEAELSFDKHELPFSISIKNDSLLINSFNPIKRASSVRLEAHQGDKLFTKLINLPHKEKLNNFVDTYWVNYEGKNKSIIVSEEQDQLQILATRTQDSLFMTAENSRKISFRYFLFRNQSLIDKGQSDKLVIKRKSNSHDSYSLSVQYVWAGEGQTKEFDIPFDKKNLDIKIDHAPIVYPGENTAFAISVNDAFGKPVENVDLTAYAITKKFPSQHVVSVPDLSKPKRKRVAFNEFNTKRSDTDILKRLDYSYWRKTLGLDSITFYKFMFPDSGYFEDRSKADMTQFAPFVIGYGIETVAVIYVDGQPVYYKGVGTVEPYSFTIKPGIHKIQLRLRNALLTVNNVRIDSVQKLIFSVNRYRLPKNCTSVEMPYKFTEDELEKLSRHFVQVRWNMRNPNAYLSQGDLFYVFGKSSGNYYGTNQLAGPFYPGKTTYFEKDGFHLTFDYEPFNSYEFKENILKMRQFSAANTLKGDRLGWYSSAPPPFSDEVFTKQKVEEYWKNNQDIRINAFRRFPEFKQIPNRIGKLTLDYFGDGNDQFLTKATFIVNLDNPDEYYVLPHLAKSEQFNEGRYQAVILLHDNKYVKADSIVIKPYGTSYYNLFSKYKTQEPDSFSIHVLKLIEKWSAPEKYLLRERELELQRLRSLYYQESSASYAFTHTVTGKVTDDNGEGIPGVNVLVKGTAVGTVTDMEGYYTVKCPPDGNLVFSFIGYQTVEQLINSDGVVNAKLNEDVRHLSEVVVVGYGVERSRRELAASTALAGRVAGISINGYAPGAADSVSIRLRGLASTNGNQEPLVILDGRIVRLSDVNKNLVTAIEVIKGSDAVALYGPQAANGVVLMSTKAGASKTYLKEMSKGVMLVGVLEGVPGNSLRKNFRDYAFWQTSLRTDENGKATFTATFPDDITGWNAYVLGMGTKRRTGQTSSSIQSYKPLVAQIVQPHFLIDGDQSMALGKITNYSQENIQLNRTIKINEKLIADDVVELSNSKIDTISLTPSGNDSVSVEYAVSFKNYKDGELRKIPVFRKGTLETNGQFFALDTDTTFTLDFSNTNESIKLYAQADLLDVLIDELTYLKEYAYECNEQLASKLKGLLLEKTISEYEKTKFSGDRDIQKIVRKLTANQNDDGSWSWWKGGSGEIWITLHVTKSLLRGENEGYKTAIDKEQLIDYLESQLTTLSVSTKLDVMNFLAEQGQVLKVKELIDSIKDSKTSTVYEKLLAERLSQSMGHKVDWKWLNSMRSKTIKGNFYWGEDKVSVYDNSILNTLLVYQMATRDNSRNKDIAKIENYFLEQRRKHWRNTYESSIILENLLSEIMKRGQLNTKPNLQLSGSVTKTVNSFPQELSASPGNLTITKTGNAAVYFTAYTEQWNDTPDQRDNDFTIRTSFDHSTSTLAAGKPVKLNVELEVKNDAEYVMIEIPIPAGCSYQSKSQSRSNAEVHREYYNHKTNIYCKYLKKGKYNYTIELLPRYSGTYTLNPAVVECMYFPTLSGREGLKTISIK
ncbi:MAG: carboxypeptidase-like regulatory domain-containing protein [Cyclobacteriaceae bacterium]